MKHLPSAIVNRDDGECAAAGASRLVLMGFNMKILGVFPNEPCKK
jgi:hypothetical protein